MWVLVGGYFMIQVSFLSVIEAERQEETRMMIDDDLEPDAIEP
jgi:hypothetical protein